MDKIISDLFLKKPSLLFCIIMDLIGMASILIPSLDEWSDILWAPISAYIFYQRFGGLGGLLGGAFSFLEELLPYTDIIPTFTIAWYIQNKGIKNNPLKRSSNNEIEDAEVIEIK
jgi:hypothetical protein